MQQNEQRPTVEEVYQLLTKQEFAVWYLMGSFDSHIESGTPNKEVIIEQLTKML